MKRVIRAASAQNQSVFIYDGTQEVPKDVVRVKVADGVTEISNDAFNARKNLTSIEIPNSVTSIGDRAFCYCERLEDVTIPSSVIHIGEAAFWGCRSFTSINIPDSVKTLGSIAFRNCVNVTSLTISKSIKQIREATFAGCVSLTSVVIPDSVTILGIEAFSDCTRLVDVKLPESLKRVSPSAFEGCPVEYDLPGIAAKSRPTPKLSQLKNALYEGETDDLCYNSKYSDYMSELYQQAVTQLQPKFKELTIQHPDTNYGDVHASFIKNGVKYSTTWDYPDERQQIEEMVMESVNFKQLVSQIRKYIQYRVESAEPSEDSDSDLVTL